MEAFRIDMNKSFSKLIEHLVKKARTRMLEVGSDRDLVDKLRVHVELLECIKASMQGDEGSWATSKNLRENRWHKRLVTDVHLTQRRKS